MKNLFFIFLFLFLNIGSAMAISFYPSNLVFDLDVGEEGCEEIAFFSDSEEVELFDVWGESDDVDWKVGFFKYPSEVHELELDYPESVLNNEESFEVCVRGYEKGEYRGALILREEQVGNSIIQGGVWLKVLVEGGGDVQLSDEIIKEYSSNKGGNPSDEEKEDEIIKRNKGIGNENPPMVVIKEDNSGITGAVIGSGIVDWKNGIIFVLVVIILSMIVYNQRKRKKKKVNVDREWYINE